MPIPSDDSYFREVEEVWDLPKLYRDMKAVGWTLSPTQKKYLRGALSGYSLQEIARILQVSQGTTKVQLSENIYKAIRELTGTSQVNFKTLPELLTKKGYRKESLELSSVDGACDLLKVGLAFVEGKTKDDTDEQLEALNRALNALLRSGMLTVQFSIPKNPGGLTADEVKDLRDPGIGYVHSFPAIIDFVQIIRDIRREILYNRHLAREKEFFFQELHRVATKHLITNQIAIPETASRDLVLRAFFQSCSVVLRVDHAERLEPKARERIGKALQPLLKGSKAIFVSRENNLPLPFSLPLKVSCLLRSNPITLVIE